MKKVKWVGIAGALVLALGLINFGTAEAGPVCGSVPAVIAADFVSCVAEGQDTFANVQAALDLALEPDVDLDADNSFCTAGSCGGSEFFGDNPGAGFDVDISGDDFTFVSLPPGTLFVTIKQGDAFEIFGVEGNGGLPFTVQHQLVGSGFSHFSTFAGPTAVPEPSALILLSLGVSALAARGWASRRK